MLRILARRDARLARSVHFGYDQLVDAGFEIAAEESFAVVVRRETDGAAHFVGHLRWRSTKRGHTIQAAPRDQVVVVDDVVNVCAIPRECEAAEDGGAFGKNAEAVGDGDLAYPQTVLAGFVERIGDIVAIGRDGRRS